MMGHRPVLVLSELGGSRGRDPLSTLSPPHFAVGPQPGPARVRPRSLPVVVRLGSPLCRSPECPEPGPLSPCPWPSRRAAGTRALRAAAPLLAWFSVRGWGVGCGLAWPGFGAVAGGSVARGAPPDRLARASGPY